MVEGSSALSAEKPDRIGDGGWILENVRCWKASNGEALFDEPGVSRFVALGAITHIMGDAVDLDDEPGFSAVEVEDIEADRMLAPETNAGRLFPQLSP